MVILAILDDLMFTSKIKLAASQIGAPVGFARSAESALAEMRKNPPALVILDLNNPRTDPLGTVAAMKADAKLADIPTLGFVSHVDTVTIDAAANTSVARGATPSYAAVAPATNRVMATIGPSPIQLGHVRNRTS